MTAEAEEKPLRSDTKTEYVFAMLARSGMWKHSPEQQRALPVVTLAIATEFRRRTLACTAAMHSCRMTNPMCIPYLRLYIKHQFVHEALRVRVRADRAAKFAGTPAAICQAYSAVRVRLFAGPPPSAGRSTTALALRCAPKQLVVYERQYEA